MTAPTPSALFRRVSKQLETGKGIRLSADELEVYASITLSVLAHAAAEYQREKCQRRNEQNHSTSVVNTNSTRALGGTLKSFGTTPTPSGSAELARARKM